jgi:ribosomal protein S12 methylthiotransferase accessory factor
MSATFYTAEEIVERVEGLASPRTGIVGPAFELPLPAGSPEVCCYSTPVCDVSRMAKHISGKSDDGLGISGTGSALRRDLARAKSYCEAIERYCNVVHLGVEHVVASRDELGDEAVDLELFPRCSQAEYAATKVVIPPSNKARMRWVRGYSLTAARPLWVPMVAVYLGAGFQYPGENFALPISTGCALAASLAQATVSGICEAVERDSITLTWLHRLPLSPIDTSDIADPRFRELTRRMERASIRQLFFDATSDLGVGTVYALQVAEGRPIHALVMASTRLNPVECLTRVIEEAAASRFGLEQARRQPHDFDPDDYGTFTRLADGAVFYGDEANFAAFDFLLGPRPTKSIRDLPVLESGDVDLNLSRLVNIFRARGLELLVVDITARPVREIGMHVVKVIAPQLVPLSANHNARFTATPRLYEAPARMGYAVKPPVELNHWPQPFA